MGNGIIICNRVGGGAKWPMVAHIRFNREVHLYCHMPDAQLEQISHMADLRAYPQRRTVYPEVHATDHLAIGCYYHKKILNR